MELVGKIEAVASREKVAIQVISTQAAIKVIKILNFGVAPKYRLKLEEEV